MDNVFTKAAGAGSHRKFGTQPKTSSFSPSYGVRKGFIKDPNWPPAEFPTEGLATSRRFRRVPASFQVRIGAAEAITVTGNVSSGGVMFVLSNPLTSDQVEVSFEGHQAAAEVLACEAKGPQQVCRARFTDPDAAGDIWVALMKTR